MDILETVKTELNKRYRSLRKISLAEPDLEYFWLVRVASGKIKSPGVLKIQKLLDYFEKNPA